MDNNEIWEVMGNSVQTPIRDCLENSVNTKTKTTSLPHSFVRLRVWDAIDNFVGITTGNLIDNFVGITTGNLIIDEERAALKRNLDNND